MSSNVMISLRPQNVIRHLPWQLDGKVAFGVLLILAIFSLVGWVYLTQASAVTATSYQIHELRLELDQLKNQNAALVLEIAKLEALSRVESRAKELGFASINEVHYLSIAEYPVSSPEDISPYRGTNPVKSNVDTYVVRPDASQWWVSTLDTMAAWVDKD